MGTGEPGQCTGIRSTVVESFIVLPITTEGAALVRTRVKAHTMLKIGLTEQALHTRYSPTELVRAAYLTAAATRLDSFWVPDHLKFTVSPIGDEAEIRGFGETRTEDRCVVRTVDAHVASSPNAG